MIQQRIGVIVCGHFGVSKRFWHSVGGTIGVYKGDFVNLTSGEFSLESSRTEETIAYRITLIIPFLLCSTIDVAIVE